MNDRGGSSNYSLWTAPSN